MVSLRQVFQTIFKHLLNLAIKSLFFLPKTAGFFVAKFSLKIIFDESDTGQFC